jgi:hypothetical protein
MTSKGEKTYGGTPLLAEVGEMKGTQFSRTQSGAGSLSRGSWMRNREKHSYPPFLD